MSDYSKELVAATLAAAAFTKQQGVDSKSTLLKHYQYWLGEVERNRQISQESDVQPKPDPAQPNVW